MVETYRVCTVRSPPENMLICGYDPTSLFLQILALLPTYTVYNLSFSIQSATSGVTI